MTPKNTLVAPLHLCSDSIPPLLSRRFKWGIQDELKRWEDISYAQWEQERCVSERATLFCLHYELSKTRSRQSLELSKSD